MTPHARKRALGWHHTLLLLIFVSGWVNAGQEADDGRPEQPLVDAIIAGAQPQGVVFVVMEDDEEALQWVLPRVTAYTRQLRDRWQQLPITLLSHGDEMFSLVSASRNLYPDIHGAAEKLVAQYQVHFQVCGAFAAMSQVAAADFPDYLDVVPFAPAEIENYRLMEFKIVNLELTW